MQCKIKTSKKNRILKTILTNFSREEKARVCIKTKWQG